MNDEKLVYIGKVIELISIPNADFIVGAVVVCGQGGKWRGVVKKSDFAIGDLCLVYLPDALIPESPEMQFMASSNWRVRMRKLRGMPSEVLIMPTKLELPIGTDCTLQLGVKKYFKEIPANLNGVVKGNFPHFIPKTDELNYQSNEEIVNSLVGKPYYISEKVDGSSTTAFRFKGELRVCIRNLELLRDENNGYWKIALKYKLEEMLPEGIAIQWETCGPKIQGNPMGLKEIDGFVFSAYNILEHRYLNYLELYDLSKSIKFPMVRVLRLNKSFDKQGLETLGEGVYSNGKHVQWKIPTKEAPLASKSLI